MKKKDTQKRQNRPNWRKIRGQKRKLIRNRQGNPVKPRRHRTINIKTKVWQEVK